MKKVLIIVLFVVFGLNCFAQQKAANADSKQASEFRSSVHLVVVDVVATDNHSHPVADLTREDFMVMEDGKQQEIKNFEPRVNAVKTGLQPASASNEYRNTPASLPTAVNIVLLDMLNTPTHDQADARRHLVGFLRTLPPGRQVALYTLDTRLHLVQNFTSDSDTLIASAEKLLSKPSVLDSESERNDNGELARTIEANAPAMAAERIRDFLRNTETAKTDNRVALTLQSLEQIARSVAGVPGRKNLIWLSSGFPLDLEPDYEGGAGRVSTAERNYRAAVEQTAAFLAASQIAVYPVDAQGVAVAGVDVTVSGRGMFDTERGGTYGDVMSAQATQYSSIHNTMDVLAKDTGGEAFYNSNDLKGAIGRSIDEGSSYYTITYTPTNNNWDGKLRKIEVKTKRKGTKLLYRRNYFAIPDRQYTEPQLRSLLIASLDPDVAVSTMLGLGVKLIPDDKKPNFVFLEYSLDPRQYQFVDKSAKVDLVVAGSDKAGKRSGEYGLQFKIPEPKDPSQTELRFRQEIELRPGTKALRIGVVDLSSGRIGTLDVPISSGAGS